MASTSKPVSLPAPQPVVCPIPDLGEHFGPLNERLEIMTSKLRVLRDGMNQEQHPLVPSLDAELALAEVKGTLGEISRGVEELCRAERPQSYAQVVAKPAQHTNHPDSVLK
ncbi:Polyphosphate kinase [Operophtera brumata]|uniref:Polyphosphate kinase n=1 Tax=Operophtera brumata TaxID=104452 RepID=A0A0L7L481_OPEBR|nr:Polyphosphate kinase [Operophtera brumata]